MREILKFLTDRADTTYYMDSEEEAMSKMKSSKCVIIVDRNIEASYKHDFDGYKLIVIEPGEESKNIETVMYIVRALLKLNVNKKTFLIGVGGGVITDIVGLVSAVYMRGIAFGFIPTSLLGMVDASVGGKNGVNVDGYKNIFGVIRQPSFVTVDMRYLSTLPKKYWCSGFAEIIKYGFVFAEDILDVLEAHSLEYYTINMDKLQELVQRCIRIKEDVVRRDEMDANFRKVLNFGHTVGHAIENIHKITHGEAISIGMMVACVVSEGVVGFDGKSTRRLKSILEKYELPSYINYDVSSILTILQKDKKADSGNVDYILLESVGKAVVNNISTQLIEKALKEYSYASGNKAK